MSVIRFDPVNELNYLQKFSKLSSEEIESNTPLMERISGLANHFFLLKAVSFQKLSIPLKLKILSQVPGIKEQIQKEKISSQPNAKPLIEVKNQQPPFEGDLEPFLDEGLAKELFSIGGVFTKFLNRHYLSINGSTLTIKSGQLTQAQILTLLMHIPQKEKENIRVISLRDSDNLESLEFLQGFSNVESVDISGSHSVTTLRGIEHCKALKELVVSHCSKLVSLDGLPNTLESLRANSCVSLNRIDAIKRCPLKLLDLSSNTGITSLEDITNLVSLETLYLRHLPKLTTLNRLQLLVNLKKLDISYTSVADISAINGRKLELFKYESCPFAVILPPS